MSIHNGTKAYKRKGVRPKGVLLLIVSLQLMFGARSHSFEF